MGSGGATLNVLRYIHQDAGSFDDKRILVIHSGGDSKRVPQYSACGKLFSPVPRLLPNGRRSTLFDEFMISMCGVAARIRAGMLVCSGDVLLLFNPLQIDFYGSGAAALSIKEPAEIGKNHGVYRVDEQGNVGGFLHKKTVDQLHELKAADENGNVDIDTGAVIMDTDLLKALYKLVDTPEQFDAYVNENTRLSFYADFLYPLASQSSLEQYYKETPEGDFTPELEQCRTELWSVLHPYQMKLIRMSPAAFIHFGTTKELRELMTERMDEFYYLGWTSNINTNREEADFAASNSYVSPNAEIGKGSYLVVVSDSGHRAALRNDVFEVVQQAEEFFGSQCVGVLGFDAGYFIGYSPMHVFRRFFVNISERIFDCVFVHPNPCSQFVALEVS